MGKMRGARIRRRALSGGSEPMLLLRGRGYRLMGLAADLVGLG